jgi:AcrR family transcriptional regulator
MPKVVARPERRELLVRVTWDLIVAEGLDRVTLRRVASAAGFANGALKPYFATKSDLLNAAYTMAFDHTIARAEQSIGTRSGLEALRRLCWEVMPLDEERRIEARVVIAFWEAAVADPSISAVARSTVTDFARSIARHLDEARALQEIGPLDDPAVVDEILWILMGLQSMVWVVPEETGTQRQCAVLERVLATLPPAQTLAADVSPEAVAGR